LLRALYADLIAPLAGAVPANGTPVVIEPHGSLWLLPFVALQDDDGTWLADRWPLLFAPSADVLDEIRRDQDYGAPGELKPLVVGNPVMPSPAQEGGMEITLQPLPGAEREARAIAGLFGDGVGPGDTTPTLLLGPAADWATVVAQMPRHGIVHLATHGLANARDPLASFVALGVPKPSTLEALHQRQGSLNWPQTRFFSQFLDSQGASGLLTAEQILYLPLPADLVTLSACQTGLGQISGDGMIGLARSFLVAGARAVLVSQWSVSDEATAELMLAFYRHYLALDDKALALQRAMQELRAREEYAHPRYWAPFVVVGAEA
jgi:CHAT domain-containing protein